MATELQREPLGISDRLTADLNSPDWAVRGQAIQQLGELLRKNSAPALGAVAAGHLKRLADDGKWEVRHAVAGALQYLLHPDFDKIIAKLTDDPNGYVRSAAAQTLQRRRQLTRLVEHAGGEHEALLREVTHLRSRYSPDLADKAIRLGQTYCQVSVAGIAHDILNVLTALQQSLRSLDKAFVPRGARTGKALSALEDAKRRCTMIERSVRDLKDFADRTPSEFQRAKVLEMIHEAVGMVEDQFRDETRARRVRRDIAVGEQLAIDAPRVHLVEALTNVIKNSYESFSNDGVLSISARASGERLVLEITDNGCGMPDEVRQTAFMPGTSTKKGKAGCTDNTGMGLANAYKVIEQECAGEIRIASEEGRGTTVTISLPMTRSSSDGGE